MIGIQPTAEHSALVADSLLIDQVARALHHATQAQQGIPADFDALSPQEKYLAVKAATIAFFLLNQAVVTAATFRAAKVLADERYGLPWDALAPRQRNECYQEAKTVIVAYEQHLQRINSEQVEREAVRIANEAIARTAAKRAEQRADKDDAPDGLYDVGHQLSRLAAQNVVPFTKGARS